MNANADPAAASATTATATAMHALRDRVKCFLIDFSFGS
jgi:hypothetical protein